MAVPGAPPDPNAPALPPGWWNQRPGAGWAPGSIGNNPATAVAGFGTGGIVKGKQAYNDLKNALNGPPTNRLQESGARAVTDADKFRALNAAGGEGELATSLQGTISGATPSVAEEELHQQTAQNASQQLGFASGLGGLNAALARRTAAENIGRQNQAAVGQQQMLRAKEITDAQSKLGALYGQESGQQLSEEQLAEQAYRDQLAAQSTNRGQNMQLLGAGASGLGSALGHTGGGGGSSALSFTPPSDPNGVATLNP